MKKFILCLVAVMGIMSASITAMAADDISVKLDDRVIEFDVPAQVINDRTMVPMRKIFESLGANVNWIESEKGIVGTKGSKIIVMKIGSSLMLVADVANGTEDKITLDVPPQVINDRTLVPVRAISESLGIDVDWDGETKTVIMTSK